MNSFVKKLLFFCLGYGLLLGLFHLPMVRHATADVFSSIAAGFQKTLLPSGYLHIERAAAADLEPLNVVRVLFGNHRVVNEQLAAAKKAGKAVLNAELKEFQIKMEEFFWMPLVFFLALLLITPLGWRRKIVAAVLGILLILGFTQLKLLCYTLYNYAQFPCGVYELKGAGFGFVSFVYDYLKMGANVLFATLVWALTAFRFSDWRKTLNGMG